MTKPEDILIQYPAKNKAGKQKVLESVQEYVQSLGYPVRIEKDQHLVIGNMQQAKFFVLSGTALSGLAAWLEMLRTFPENQRHKVCFIFCDGRKGISSFYKTHGKEIADCLVIHLHHVGDGNHLRLFPTKQLKENRLRLTSLYRACGYFGPRDLLVSEEKIPRRLKPYACFPYAVTICALYTHKKHFQYNHKTRNTALDTTNVNILRAALTTFLCCDEVN